MSVDMWVGVAMFGAAMFGLGLLAGWSLLFGTTIWAGKDEPEVPWTSSTTEFLPYLPEPAPKRRKRAK